MGHIGGVPNVEFRIALVAEGKTDQIVIESALSAILDQPFILTLLQPETSDLLGSGPTRRWMGGVYRWCRQAVSMRCPVAENPSLTGFDLILVHVDADVAGLRYEDAGIEDGRTDLPCERPCPPAANSVNALRGAVAVGSICRLRLICQEDGRSAIPQSALKLG